MMRDIVFILGNSTRNAAERSKCADAETVIMNLGHGVLTSAWLPDGIEREACTRIDFALIDAADVVVALPDWEGSENAQQEMRYAIERRKTVAQYNKFVSSELKNWRKANKQGGSL